MQTNHHSFHSFRLRQFVRTVLICIVSICAGRSRDIELNLVCLHLLALGQITCCSTSVHLSAPFCTFLHLSPLLYVFSLFSPLTVDNVDMSERHLLSQVQARRASSRALALARETCDSKLEASAALMAEDGRDLRLAGRGSKS